jgi:hypothetical protein
MSLISLLLAVVCLGVTAIAWVDARHRGRALDDLRSDIARQRIDRQELGRFLRSREAVAEGGDLTIAVVNAPTAITRFSHDAISAIPFTVLENIPATAETSKIVREIHDEISHTVYDVISGTTKGIAGLIRRGLNSPPGARPSPTPMEQPAQGRPPAPSDEQSRPRPRPSSPDSAQP